MIKRNTKDCFREFIGMELKGVLFDSLPYRNDKESKGTKTLVFENGRGLTIANNGDYWVESDSNIKVAIIKKKNELEEMSRDIHDILTIANEQDPSAELDNQLSVSDIDSLKTITVISMCSASTVLSSLIGVKVDIDNPVVEIGKARIAESQEEFIVVRINYSDDLRGSSEFLLPKNAMLSIVDFLTGGDGKVDIYSPLTDFHLSAVVEMFNQMIGASVRSLSQTAGKFIDIEEPTVHIADAETYDDCEKVCIEYSFLVDGLDKTTIIQTMSVQLAKIWQAYCNLMRYWL